MTAKRRIVIVGGGFGGLYCAQHLCRDKRLEVTLIDKENYHLFQPLLYQVATGGLSPEDIASPLRGVLSNCKNVRVLQGKADDIRPEEKVLLLGQDEIHYDYIVVAAGGQNHYFGSDEWEDRAPGLKNVDDALEMRDRLLQAFEEAENEKELSVRKEWMRFVIVGGGPTGVELAGALAELSHQTLAEDFRHIDPREAEIFLIEVQEELLPGYPLKLRQAARSDLEELGVEVLTETKVETMDDEEIRLSRSNQHQQLRARTILWAAGIRPVDFSEALSHRTDAKKDRLGRIEVLPDLSLDAFPEISVIGDMASVRDSEGDLLPGIAPVAMQQGRYVARKIRAHVSGKSIGPFRYRDRGKMAVIGRNSAVADLGKFGFTGLLAWLLWVFIHIMYLVEFGNKLVVMAQWGWNYLTRKKGARLIGRARRGKIAYKELRKSA